MLEKVSTILKMADESNTAVISFICTDYNIVLTFSNISVFSYYLSTDKQKA